MGASKKTPLPGARERIVATASMLFYREGLRATGIDKIIAESGVAKMSFYRYFPSKTNLITEYLRLRSEGWLTWFKTSLEGQVAQSGGGMEAVAEVLRSWFAEADFRGCPFINALAENPSPEPEVAAVIRGHQANLEAWLEDLAARLDYVVPKQAAASTMLIMQGAIVRTHMTWDHTVVETCLLLLKKLPRHVRKPEAAERQEDPQLYLPGIGM